MSQAPVEILVAEDSPTQAERLRYVLEESGYRVTTAASGRDALSAARDRPPDLVITDVVMPEMDGYTLCKRLKSEEALRDIPVILLTSLSEPQDVIKGLECGADNFIRKPYEETRLLARVANILASQELRDSGKLRIGVEVVLGGQKHFITSERQQILDFLFSSYEEIALANETLKAQQIELEAQQRELERALTINRAVLDASLDAVCLVDLEGNVLLTNAVLERMSAEILHLPREGSIYERLAALAEHTGDPAGFRAALEAIASEPERQALDEYELVALRRWIKRYTAPVREADGVGRIFVFRDVSAEREAERLKSELVATVSHELRTPLASILGFTELLLAKERDQATRTRYVETIQSEAKRLSALINDFLDLQRIEAGRFELSLGPVELGELLGEAVELYALQSGAHELALELPSEPLVVKGERDRIAQVVGNLLSNAIKYSPRGGRVEVSAEARGGSVRVSVRDFGLGIPADEQERVFSKFFRVHASETREIGGTGLGLALCKEIVHAHGGEIGFGSVEGEGSTFWFDLPAMPISEETGPRRVLVVEDDPAAASLLEAYLAEDGYAVEVVGTGEEAIARAHEDPPALVCLDILLPGELDGWDVLAELKAHPMTANIPVVVCTVVAEGRERAAALGAADFLAKPFSDHRLRQVVRRLAPAPGASVLVVDDEENVRDLVKEVLAEEGLDPREAADGVQALSAVAESRPDAIVLDLVMPGLDGFQVLERLQDDPDTRSIPVVVLTGKHLSAAERASLRAHSVALLEKNRYSREELRRLVELALGPAAPWGGEP